MSYPVIEDITETTPQSATTHTIDYPATVDADDLLIVIFACDDNEPITCTAFQDLYEEDAGNSGPTLYVGWRKAVGDEDGTTFEITTGGTEGSCAYVIRITGAMDPTTQPPEVSAEASGSSSNPNSLSLTPTGGSKDYLFISAAANDDDDDVTVWPSNMGDNQIYSQQTDVTLGIATEDVTAISFDPAQFTIAAGETWDAVTIAVHPFAAATYERSVLLDVALQKTGIERSVDLDVALQKAGLQKSVDLDVVLQKIIELSVDLDVALQKLGVERTVDLDVALQKAGIERSVLLDVLLKIRAEKTVDLDVALQKTGIQRTVDLDVALKKTGIQRSVLLDVLLEIGGATTYERTVLLDTVLQAIFQRTVDLDVALQKTDIEKSVDLDVALQKLGIERSVDLDVLLKLRDTKTVPLDIILKALGVTRTVDLDVALKKTGITKTVLLDVVLSAEIPGVSPPVPGQIRRRRRPRPRPELGSFTREIGVTIYEELTKLWPFLTRVWEFDDLVAGLHQIIFNLENTELGAFNQTIYETEILEAEVIPYQMFGIIEDLGEDAKVRETLAKVAKMKRLRRILADER